MNLHLLCWVLQIDRVQNATLWQAYQVMKKSMDQRPGRSANEKQLFHGTSAKPIADINKYGFNRSYAGINGNYSLPVTIVTSSS